MRARIVLEIDENAPLEYINEFTTWLRKFRFVKEAYFEVVQDVEAEREELKAACEGIGSE